MFNKYRYLLRYMIIYFKELFSPAIAAAALYILFSISAAFDLFNFPFRPCAVQCFVFPFVRGGKGENLFSFLQEVFLFFLAPLFLPFHSGRPCALRPFRECKDATFITPHKTFFNLSKYSQALILCFSHFLF